MPKAVEGGADAEDPGRVLVVLEDFAVRRWLTDCSLHELIHE